MWFACRTRVLGSVAAMAKTDLDLVGVSGLPTEDIIQLMMNVDNDEKEPVTDLGLALGYSNQSIKTRSNNDSGAGVNASSRFDMTFVPSDPLTELVWSPHKGLSLKCTDCSLAEKTPSLLWDVGPRNTILSPPLSITSRETNDEKPLEKRDLFTSQAAVHVESEVGNRASMTSSPGSSAGVMPVVGSSHEHHTRTSGDMEEMKTLEGASVLYINQKAENIRENEGRVCRSNEIQMTNISETMEDDAGQGNQRTTDFLALGINERRPELTQREPLSRECNIVTITDPGGRIGDVASDSQMLGFEVSLAADVHSLEQCEAFGNLVSNSTSPGRRPDQLALVIDEGSKMKTHGSTSASPLEKLEFTGENDLWRPISNDDCGQSEERVPRDKSVQLEASPTNSRIHLCSRKGKEKALSDRDVDERMSKEEDDSHESVESCNGAGLFSTGKRQWSFEQQLIVGSKTVKKQIQESPASTSVIRQDSSFMNWISNMVKGLNKSNQDEAPSLTLSLSHPNYGHENHDQGIIPCNKSHDPGSRNLGFQTVFQSLYCSKAKVQETSMCIGNYPVGGSKEVVLADKTRASITPINCHGKNDKCKQFLLSGDGGPSIQPGILSSNIASTQEICKTYSGEHKTSCNLACGKGKDVVRSSNSSLGKRKTNSAENNNYDLSSEGKAIHNVDCKSNPLRSLWITRFSPKSIGPVLNLDHCNHITRKELEGSADCGRLIPHVQTHADFSTDEKSSEAKEYSTVDPENVVAKELQNYAPNTEASCGLKKVHGHNDQKSIYKLNPRLPSQKLKSAVAMASMFARRLDALKHIIPSDVKDDATCMMITCFFCGRSGHDLRDCSEITETELNSLLRNITSYDGAEESLCFCIRCFQLDHWAISCPIPSSRGQLQSECGASLVDHYSANKVQLTAGNEKYARMLETKENHPPVAVAHTICARKKSRIDTDSSPNLKWSGIMTSDQRISKLKNISSSSGENKLEETQITPLCNFVNKQISDVPKGMFDAIRKLRLSRMDILKWMNSQISLPHLNGFFLRLRLGKGEGPGGTGYYVACITGAQREKSPQNSKNSILVDVGGIKCPVESRYVSNHDFLEDELMTWWCTTLTSGGKIPSEDDLKLKFEERRRQIGFNDASECPELCKLAYEYLKTSKGFEDIIYEYFAKEPNAKLLYVKLVEELDRCILGYFAFHWSHASLMICQVLSVGSEQKKLKDLVMAATRKRRFEKVIKDLKMARVFSTLVEEMKAIGSVGESKCTDVMVPVAHNERSPVLLLMGGGMGAGKSTVLKDILKESFWSGAAANAVVVEADAFKETDVHQSSTDAASSLLVTALNEGRDVIMDGTLSWEPFLDQTIAMARNVHKHRYRMGVGYKVEDDGAVTENYWEQVEEEEENGQEVKRKPYRIELVGVVCDPFQAVVRGIRRAIFLGRAVRVNSQLKSHKRFASAFSRYSQLVDNARLYCTNAVCGPPRLIAWKDGNNKLLVDPEEIKSLTMVSSLNDAADSIYELYPNPDMICEPGSVWKDMILLPTRASLQQELKTSSAALPYIFTYINFASPLNPSRDQIEFLVLRIRVSDFHLQEWRMLKQMWLQDSRRRGQFKKFSFRGVDLDALLDMSTDELVKLFTARARRRFQRGLKRKPMALIKKLRKAKREAPPGEKPEPVKTHLRNMIIVPEMIGSIIGVYNGKTFNHVEIKPEMIGHYLAEFSISYKPVKHGRPGIGATHSSRFIPLK
ncbi:hypothetical protein F0562_000438 [Nyssa sinensis]|uniref:CCHC-type domain-containing protein n=3 Tax=Magnoliopsida TaxID=3398 RepID=A0A5J5C1L0_9ASTE|nr:hypothetical protein F0562_000438 [Nyssa sinensis]